MIEASSTPCINPQLDFLKTPTMVRERWVRLREGRREIKAYI